MKIPLWGSTMDKYIMAIDQGTTSSKAFIVNRSGKIVGRGGREFRQIYPKPGWVEHDAMEVWEAQLRACRDALKDASISGRDVEALGITNQRETTVVWERETGRPITNAIVWQCRRTAGLCEQQIARGRAEAIRRKTGLIVDAYFSATKLQWILREVPSAAERAIKGELCFGTIDSWLIFTLTGGSVHVTDPSNASRTMLFNINSQMWDDDLLDWFEVPGTMLPTVTESSGIVGETNIELFGAPIPISGIVGDQQAALFGHGCFDTGETKNTYGTGCFLLANIGNSPTYAPGLITSIGWNIEGETTYVLEGSVFIAGAAIQWLKDNMGIIEQSEDIEALALTVQDNGGTHFLPAFVGLGTPYWDMNVRGMIVGITGGTRRGHLARATLEAIAHQSADVLQAMEDGLGRGIGNLKVDGGAAENDLLMQLQADILGVPVTRTGILQATAIGAAYLAGLATGYWTGIVELRNLHSETTVFTPNMKEQDRLNWRTTWHNLVKLARTWPKLDDL
jgi:glycerol kinase